MKYTEIKKIKAFCETLFSTPDWREVVQKIEAGENDFMVNDVRFINDNDIQSILEDELANDEYTLGCFSASAISQATDWPQFLIEAAQKAEEYEAIGKELTGEHISALASIYIEYDGYGHHFNHYDGVAEELTVNDECFYVFDNH